MYLDIYNFFVLIWTGHGLDTFQTCVILRNPEEAL